MTQQAITEDARANGATPEATPAPSAQSSDAFTDEQLEAIVGRVVSGHVAAAFQSLQSQITPLQQMRPQLEEVIGSARNTELMVQRIFAGTATDEDVRHLEEATKLQQAQERASKAEAQVKALAESRNSPQELAERQFATVHIPRAARLAQREGIPWREIEAEALGIQVKATATDPFALTAWDEAVEAFISGEADRRHAETKAKVIVPDTKGGGAPEQMDNISLIKRGLVARK